VVGGAGFLIDAGALFVLTSGGGLDPFSARVISIIVAVAGTWALNRTWTFRGAAAHHPLIELFRYFVVQISGGAISLCVYTVLVLMTMPLLFALAAGSATALLFNYFGACLAVFNRRGIAASIVRHRNPER
jgi:putative flippase GtrA